MVVDELASFFVANNGAELPNKLGEVSDGSGEAVEVNAAVSGELSPEDGGLLTRRLFDGVKGRPSSLPAGLLEPGDVPEVLEDAAAAARLLERVAAAVRPDATRFLALKDLPNFLLRVPRSGLVDSAAVTEKEKKKIKG